MISLFELGWQGGAAAAHFRRSRPGVDDMPWGTLDARRYPAELVERARLAWTEGAVSEYASAAAFAALLSDLLAARAPVDLVGMAGEFIADEMLHTELNARVATELGGGAPYLVDWSALAPPVTDGAPPLERAIERAVRLCCVGETLSAPLLAATARVAAHPLTKAVLSRIAREEPPHARLGWLVLDWAGPLEPALAARLVEAAVDTARDYDAYFRAPARDVEEEGFRLADVRALGWLEAPAWARHARRALRRIGDGLRAAGLPADDFETRVWR